MRRTVLGPPARSYWPTADLTLAVAYRRRGSGMAKEVAADAVAERLGSICVAQFNHHSEKSSKLQEMKDKDLWNKARYIEKQQ